MKSKADLCSGLSLKEEQLSEDVRKEIIYRLLKQMTHLRIEDSHHDTLRHPRSSLKASDFDATTQWPMSGKVKEQAVWTGMAACQQ